MTNVKKKDIDRQDLVSVAKRISTTIKEKIESQHLPDMILGILEGARVSNFANLMADEFGTSREEVKYIKVEYVENYIFGRVKAQVDKNLSVSANLESRRILLLDDIIYFGRTLNEAIKYAEGANRGKNIIAATAVVGWPQSSFLKLPMRGFDAFYVGGKKYSLFYDPYMVYKKWEEFGSSWHIRKRSFRT